IIMLHVSNHYSSHRVTIKGVTNMGVTNVHMPGMPYDFNYAVKDDYYGTDYSRNEVSDGDVVRGEYRVQLPDGRLQIVRYTADWKTGFHADVSYEGEAQYPQPAQGYNYPAPAAGAPAPTNLRTARDARLNVPIPDMLALRHAQPQNHVRVGKPVVLKVASVRPKRFVCGPVCCLNQHFARIMDNNEVLLQACVVRDGFIARIEHATIKLSCDACLKPRCESRASHCSYAA
ncbi:unnamed protein product, partial [Timema podura]|nr:unnamed protein product [Timema podura]